MENALIFASEKEVRFTKLLKFIVLIINNLVSCRI